MIEAEKADYSIDWMCTLLDVPRPTFYVWRGRVETDHLAQARVARAGQAGGRHVAADIWVPARGRPVNRGGIEVSVGTVAASCAS